MTTKRRKKNKTLAELMAGDITETSDAKAAFHRKARACLNALAKALDLEKGDFDIRSNKAGPAVSGEVILHADRFYVQVSQSAGPGDVLFRRCDGKDDFIGGANRWASAAKLDDATGFAQRLKTTLQLDETGTPGGVSAPVETKIVQIPLGRLRLSALNVRSVADPEADRALAENLKRRGQLQNLICYEADDGGFEVAGGGRRLEQMQGILRWPDDHPVNCLVAPKDIAVELSTAENLRRSSMHPADEAEAIRRIVQDNDREIDDVAAEFGMSARLVKQRLKLASLAPELIALFRAGAIQREGAMALTLTENHAHQVSAWKQVAHYPAWQDRAAGIRRILTTEKVSGEDRLARFVGIEAYRVAGGRVDRDLFSADEDPKSYWLQDAQLLGALALSKLEEEAAGLRDHWLWAEARVDFARNELWTRFRQENGDVPALPADLEAELTTLEARADVIADMENPSPEDEAEALRIEDRVAEIESWPQTNVAFSDEVRQRAGCIVTVNPMGRLIVHKGLIRPDEQQGQSGPNAAPATPAAASAAPAPGPEKPRRDPYPQVLKEDLGAYRTKALQAALMSNADVARDALLFALVQGVFGSRHSGCPTELSAAPASIVSSRADLDGSDAQQEIDRLLGALPAEWKAVDEVERFDALAELPPADKDRLLAASMALTLRAPAIRPEPTRCESLLDTLQTRLGGDDVVASRWRPTAQNFWGRMPIAHSLEIAREVLGDDWAANQTGKTRAVLAPILEQVFSGGDVPVDGVTPDARARAAAWLPPGMSAAPLSRDRSTPEDAHDPGPADVDRPAFLDDGQVDAVA